MALQRVLGAIVLPINWRLSADEVCFNLNDCRPKIAFADAEFQSMLEAMRDKLPSIEAHYNLKADLGDALEFKSLMEAPGRMMPANVSSTDGFVIIHTAAVAGRPRGALLSHGNVLCAGMHFNYYFGLSSNDVHLNLLPLFHVAGLFMATSTFHAGASNVGSVNLMPSGRKTDRGKRREPVFRFPADSVFHSTGCSGRASIISLAQAAVVGLEPRKSIEQFQSVTGGVYYCMYGQTETSCLATMGRYGDRPGSAGKIISLADVRLVDDHDQPVAAGAVGEITVKGPMVFKGYWGLPEDNGLSLSVKGGIIPAIWVVSIPMASCFMPAEKRKRNSSSPAVKTSIRRRWKRLFFSTPPWRKRSLSAYRIQSGKRVSRPFVDCMRG